VGYVAPCVRFNYFVWLSASSIAATLGMNGWLDLTQQGLSSCKKRQASWRTNGRRQLEPLVGRQLGVEDSLLEIITRVQT